MTRVRRNYDELISSYRSSGLPLRKWCIDHDVSMSAMKYHMYAKKSNKDDKDDHHFIELVTVPATQESFPMDDSITVTVGAADIRVTSDTDMTLLRRIVEVLKDG